MDRMLSSTQRIISDNIYSWATYVMIAIGRYIMSQTLFNILIYFGFIQVKLFKKEYKSNGDFRNDDKFV